MLVVGSTDESLKQHPLELWKKTKTLVGFVSHKNYKIRVLQNQYVILS
jgi:hypothetical protein